MFPHANITRILADDRRREQVAAATRERLADEAAGPDLRWFPSPRALRSAFAAVLARVDPRLAMPSRPNAGRVSAVDAPLEPGRPNPA